MEKLRCKDCGRKNETLYRVWNENLKVYQWICGDCIAERNHYYNPNIFLIKETVS
jgi:NMD protein affecting ribosome stability and mRNA decay